MSKPSKSHKLHNLLRQLHREGNLLATPNALVMRDNQTTKAVHDRLKELLSVNNADIKVEIDDFVFNQVKGNRHDNRSDTN